MKSHHSPKEESRQACGEVCHAADGVNAARATLDGGAVLSRADEINARYQQQLPALMALPVYERFFAGRAFFASWDAELSTPCLVVEW